MIWPKSPFVAVAAVWLCGLSAPAASLPSVEDVQARFVRALGGADAITRPHSMTIRGFNLAYEPNGKRTRIPFVIYAADFKRLEVHSVPGKGEFSFGYDGKTAWAVAPGAKAQLFTGSDAESIRRDADLYYFAHIPVYFRSMEVVGVEPFGGHRCYKVRGTNLWGNTNNQYYDIESGLLVGYRFHQWVGSAPEKAESVQIFDEYRRFDGLLIATRETDYRDGRLIGVGRYESIRINDVDPRVFELPRAVVALMRGKHS
jgi:hypothetical protein